jgi:hypothetical protein
MELTISNVVLHSSVRVDLKFHGIYGTTKSRIIFPWVLAFAITFGIVNVFGGEVDTEPFYGNLEFVGGVSVGQETKGYA